MPKAQRIQIPIVGGQAVSRSVVVNNQATINFIQAIKGPGAKAPIVLETAPGYVDMGAVGDGPIRSGLMVNSRIRPASVAGELYGVYGTKLIAHTRQQTVKMRCLRLASGVRLARQSSK